MELYNNSNAANNEENFSHLFFFLPSFASHFFRSERQNYIKLCFVHDVNHRLTNDSAINAADKDKRTAQSKRTMHNASAEIKIRFIILLFRKQK